MYPVAARSEGDRSLQNTLVTESFIFDVDLTRKPDILSVPLGAPGRRKLSGFNVVSHV
jgi:hypothetical protein